ncbi:MAG: cytochrome C oxidase subunit IV family protein [Fibrobacteria bacterium]|nr:cytochrome C oxidase subunit IV family protein [Fibrobacteria bacterium]
MEGNLKQSHHIGAKTYLLVWAALMVLTGVTVGVTFLDLRNFAIVAAMIVASIKALLVLLYFMHIRYEKKVFPFMILATLGMFWLFLILTFMEVFTR